MQVHINLELKENSSTIESFFDKILSKEYDYSTIAQNIPTKVDSPLPSKEKYYSNYKEASFSTFLNLIHSFLAATPKNYGEVVNIPSYLIEVSDLNPGYGVIFVR